jgi:hypothetical protein
MIRPVERFAVNIGGREAPEDAVARPPRPPRAGVGPTGIAAAACLGATLTLLVQRLFEDGRLWGLLRAILHGLVG